ncbi:MAG: hypothetical protein HY774_16865 [Acidobacteria bacterium]|nr:hypothetical protein [Acidobacteriota bacterium]
MKLSLEAAQECVRKYLEQYSKTFHQEQNRALDWFIEQQPDAGERLEPYRSQTVLILLDETWHVEYEAFFVFNHKCWENTGWGLQEVLTAGSGPILVDRETGAVYHTGSGENDDELEALFLKHKNAINKLSNQL